jgi:hypothetical protein
MSAEHTSVAVQRYLDELTAEPLIRALLDRAVRRLHQLCASLNYRPNRRGHGSLTASLLRRHYKSLCRNHGGF